MAWAVVVFEAIVHGNRVLPGLRHVFDRRVWRRPNRSARLVRTWPLLYMSLCAPFSVVMLLISPRHWVGVLTASLVWICASLHDLVRIRRGGNHEDLAADVFPPTVLENLRRAPWQAWLYGSVLAGSYVWWSSSLCEDCITPPETPGVLWWLTLPVFAILQRSDGTWGLLLLWHGLSVTVALGVLLSGSFFGSALGWLAWNTAALWILLKQPVRGWATWSGKLTSPTEAATVV